MYSHTHISALINVIFDVGRGSAVRSNTPNFTFIGAMCRPCGAKTAFGPLRKCNTKVAALRASMPVIK